ncbi:hypothetical protein HUJ04_008418 [Dendroctonus ponderosae]|nr:hypothetical protein HUJ04_008418 [Dendroctonus ponderosae]
MAQKTPKQVKSSSKTPTLHEGQAPRIPHLNQKSKPKRPFTNDYHFGIFHNNGGRSGPITLGWKGSLWGRRPIVVSSRRRSRVELLCGWGWKVYVAAYKKPTNINNSGLAGNRAANQPHPHKYKTKLTK